jgi:cytochrome c556
MTKLSRCALSSVALFAVLLAAVGCGNRTQVTPPTAPQVPGGPPLLSKQVMAKIGKPPQGLTMVIGKELEAEQPAWETLQPQAKEYARLTAILGDCDPPKGSKESWAKFTGEFTEAANALNSAAQEKDRDKAKAAHTKLQESCTKCHQEHRGRGPGG